MCDLPSPSCDLPDGGSGAGLWRCFRAGCNVQAGVSAGHGSVELKTGCTQGCSAVLHPRLQRCLSSESCSAGIDEQPPPRTSFSARLRRATSSRSFQLILGEHSAQRRRWCAGDAQSQWYCPLRPTDMQPARSCERGTHLTAKQATVSTQVSPEAGGASDPGCARNMHLAWRGLQPDPPGKARRCCCSGTLRHQVGVWKVLAG